MKPLIDQMVDKFLGWKLPEDFNPDGGITFKRDFNEGTQFPAKHEPTGTNLLTGAQAKAMLEFVAGDLIAQAERYAPIVNLAANGNMLMNAELWRDMIREQARKALNQKP